MEEEAVILYCLTKGYLDDVEVEAIQSFEQSLYSDMKTTEAGIAIANHIKEIKQLPDTQILDDYIKDFKARLM
jgi:F0F1-type ATP synthase alpha subunit